MSSIYRFIKVYTSTLSIWSETLEICKNTHFDTLGLHVINIYSRLLKLEKALRISDKLLERIATEVYFYPVDDNVKIRIMLSLENYRNRIVKEQWDVENMKQMLPEVPKR